MAAPSPVAAALYGAAHPRLAPPVPARTLLDLYLAECECIGIAPFPWQEEAGRYLYGLTPADLWLYPEVAVIVSRHRRL